MHGRTECGSPSQSLPHLLLNGIQQRGYSIRRFIMVSNAAKRSFLYGNICLTLYDDCKKHKQYKKFSRRRHHNPYCPPSGRPKYKS